MKLPGAHLKNDSAEDKLSFYEQAEKDSLKRLQARKDDPNYRDSTKAKKDSVLKHDTGIIPQGNEVKKITAMPPLNTSRASLSENERQINERLSALNKQIKQTAADHVNKQDNASAKNNDTEIARLQGAIQQMNSTNAPDPQMEQMSRMLDKIQEIQNPGLVRQKLLQQSEKNRGQVFAVSTNKKDEPVSTLDNPMAQIALFTGQSNGFYSLDNNTPPETQNAIEAVVHESQTVVNGSTVKLRLVNDIYINGVLVPKDNFIFGVAALEGDRLGIKISSIRYRHSLFPVDLSVFDIDGVNGIYIPGAITRDVAKESADQSIQNLELTTYDPSIGAQAASAGISAAKSLFSRKVKLVKVTVKAGYQVLLRDEKQKQNN